MSIKLLIDTDLGGDCDDVGAIALANILQNKNKVEITVRHGLFPSTETSEGKHKAKPSCICQTIITDDEDIEYNANVSNIQKFWVTLLKSCKEVYIIQ